MKEATELTKRILRIVDGLKADTVSLTEAETEIESVERAVESFEWTRQSGKGSNGLASRDTITFVRLVIEMARRELQNKK